MSMIHVRAILKPRKAELDYAYATQASENKQTPPTEVGYRVEAWHDGASFHICIILIKIMLSSQMK